MKLVIVSGLSGAGKSVALRQLEDLDFYCVDNFPLALMGPVDRHTLDRVRAGYSRLALGIDAREASDQIRRFPVYVERLRGLGVDVQVLFLTASDEVIARRYAETRRRHPLTGSGRDLTDAIAAERELLQPIADVADEVIDTSRMGPHELREEVIHRLAGSAAGRLSVILMSFGYKNGLPSVADYVFDVRCLPNPYWEPSLRQLSGKDAPIAEWLSRHDATGRMVDDIHGFLRHWLPAFEQQDRAYLTVAIGCTGGRHRSVYVAERLRQALADLGDRLTVRHRDIGVGG